VKISAVLITLNEEQNIGPALDSLDCADEVVVVDSGSEDRTVPIAKQRGAKVLINPWPGFAAQKQFATDSAAHDWVLSLDADERVSEKLKGEILGIKSRGPAADGYLIPRLTYYLSRPIRHGGWYPDRQMRLFDRRKGRWSERLIHESFRMSDGSKIGRLDGDILHYTVRSVEEHQRMIAERYAPLAARQMLADGKTTSLPKAVASAWLTFVRGYFLKAGFMDGYPGFCIAYLAAHNTLMKHLILRELGNNGTPTRE
jgi:glycosyltransferase involved in cell wall biosynthesis